jgi:hypothetical protein
MVYAKQSVSFTGSEVSYSIPPLTLLLLDQSKLKSSDHLGLNADKLMMCTIPDSLVNRISASLYVTAACSAWFI